MKKLKKLIFVLPMLLTACSDNIETKWDLSTPARKKYASNMLYYALSNSAATTKKPIKISSNLKKFNLDLDFETTKTDSTSDIKLGLSAEGKNTFIIKDVFANRKSLKAKGILDNFSADAYIFVETNNTEGHSLDGIDLALNSINTDLYLENNTLYFDFKDENSRNELANAYKEYYNVSNESSISQTQARNILEDIIGEKFKFKVTDIFDEDELEESLFDFKPEDIKISNNDKFFNLLEESNIFECLTFSEFSKGYYEHTINLNKDMFCSLFDVRDDDMIFKQGIFKITTTKEHLLDSIDVDISFGFYTRNETSKKTTVSAEDFNLNFSTVFNYNVAMYDFSNQIDYKLVSL